MLSVLLTLLCIGGLFVFSIYQLKVNKLVNANIHTSKCNLVYKTEFHKMNDTLDDAIKKLNEISKTNLKLEVKIDKLEKQNSELKESNYNLEKRIISLEDDNKRVIATLKNYNMIAPSLKVDKPFVLKLAK